MDDTDQILRRIDKRIAELQIFRYPRKWVIIGYGILSLLFSSGFPLVMGLSVF